MAVEFLRLREEDRKAIAEYVEQAPRAHGGRVSSTERGGPQSYRGVR
jgi:hypothetical protein